MSRSTFSILPYINRQKVKADGTANILCRITVDGKSAAISTGISCTPQEWNPRRERYGTQGTADDWQVSLLRSRINTTHFLPPMASSPWKC